MQSYKPPTTSTTTQFEPLTQEWVTTIVIRHKNALLAEVLPTKLAEALPSNFWSDPGPAPVNLKTDVLGNDWAKNNTAKSPWSLPAEPIKPLTSEDLRKLTNHLY